MQRLTMAILLTMTALTSAGCVVAAAGAAGAGVVSYVRGASQGLVEVDPPEVIDAARTVAENMEMIVTASRVEDTAAELRARTATDRRVTITADREGEGVSNLRVRVGTFGDRELSDELYRRIARRLE